MAAYMTSCMVLQLMELPVKRKKKVDEEQIVIGTKGKPTKVFIPKFYSMTGDKMEPGQEQRELIEDIFEDIRTRLMELEAGIKEDDTQFHQAVEILRDVIAESEDHFMEEYELPE